MSGDSRSVRGLEKWLGVRGVCGGSRSGWGFEMCAGVRGVGGASRSGRGSLVRKRKNTESE